MSKLLILATKTFGTLSLSQQKIFNSTEMGAFADFSTSDKIEDDPSNSSNWGEERIIEADKLTWLCTNEDAKKIVHRRGIWIKGAKIDGNLDLSLIDIPFLLGLIDCSIPDGLGLSFSKLPSIVLTGTSVSEIIGIGLRVDGDIILSENLNTSLLDLRRSKISGNLSCNKCKISRKGDKAIIADGIEIGGSIFMMDTIVEGEVRFPNSIINGNIEFDGTQIDNANNYSLLLDGSSVKGSIYLRNKFKSNGELSLIGSRIGGSLECSGGEFSNPKRVAISCDRMNVSGSVHLKSSFSSVGMVRFLGAKIGGNLECDTATMDNSSDVAFQGDKLEVSGNVFLRNGFKSNGQVRLPGAEIQGNLEFDGGEFSNEDGEAINFESAQISRNVYLGLNLIINGELSAANAIIKGVFRWNPVLVQRKAILDLRACTIKSLLFDMNSLPLKKNLKINGLVYEELIEDKRIDDSKYLELLALQGEEIFAQPYEQMARVLKASGKEELARKIQIEKNTKIYQSKNHNILEKIFHHLFKWSIGFGYEIWRPLWISICIIILGGIFFYIGNESDLIVATNGSTINSISHNKLKQPPVITPKFYSLAYSIDSFIPLIDLKQTEYWIPDANKGRILVNYNFMRIRLGGILLFYFYVHILLGWILTSLLIFGLTGVIRR